MYLTVEKKQEIIQKLQQLNIKIDFDRILNFNIDMKLAQFDKLFYTPSAKRLDKKINMEGSDETR